MSLVTINKYKYKDMNANEAANKLVITEVKITDTGVYVQASCGKTSALVAIHAHGLQVICQNASNRAWNGIGRFFPTVLDAVAGYKKIEMKAIILAADDFNH